MGHTEQPPYVGEIPNTLTGIGHMETTLFGIIPIRTTGLINDPGAVSFGVMGSPPVRSFGVMSDPACKGVMENPPVISFGVIWQPLRKGIMDSPPCKGVMDIP